MSTTATIEKDTLVIRVPLQKPTLSKSGKSHLVASTGGFAKTAALLNGQPISVSINAIIAK